MKRFWKWVKSLFTKECEYKLKLSPAKPIVYEVNPHTLSDKIYEYIPSEGKTITDDYRSFGDLGKSYQSPIVLEGISMTDKNGKNHYIAAAKIEAENITIKQLPDGSVNHIRKTN
jgi:hypothetical protein